MRWLMAYPGCQVVRPSIALRRPRVFWATWGVTPAARTCATRSRVSYPLSAPSVRGWKRAPSAPDQAWHRRTLGHPGGRGHGEVHQQAVAVLHQGVSEVTQLGRLPMRLLVQAGIWVRSTLVRLVR